MILLRILTPGEAVADMEVEWASLPGSEGRFTAMQGHDVTLARLSPGTVRCRRFSPSGEAVVEEFAVGEGMAEVTRGSVVACVSRAERTGERKGG